MLTVRLKHKFWTVVGDCSLMGMYAKAMLANPDADPSVFVLEIEQTSMNYRRRNNGPALMIVPEFVPMCLIKDVLSMTKDHNINVQIKVIEIDEEPEID